MPNTPLRACPLSFTFHAPASLVDAEGKPAQSKMDVATCVGPQCQLWQFEPGTDPATGDCSFNLTAQATSLVALLAQKAFNVGVREAESEVARG